jgi:hypothetical protein
LCGSLLPDRGANREELEAQLQGNILTQKVAFLKPISAAVYTNKFLVICGLRGVRRGIAASLYRQQ